jgi:transcriptional regulator with XRE-family HTH domain
MPRPTNPLKIPAGKKLTPELAFAVVLREKRLALGLTQADLEGDDELDHSYISRLERGERQVCLRGIISIAGKLQMKPEELLAEVMRRVEGL